MPWRNIVLVGVGSFLLGGAAPIAYYWLVLLAQRSFRATSTSWLTAFSAFLLSFGVTSAGLVYLSTTSGGQPGVIVIAYMIGVGLARWVRGDYRYK